MMKQVDYIIVGQGLAGTALAQTMHDNGSTFVVIDQLDNHQASRVASGIWNPIVLKRMKKVWEADAMLAEMMPFYKRAEELFQSTLIDDKKVNRLFSSEKEIDEWISLSDQPAFIDLIDSNIQRDKIKGVDSQFGRGSVKQSGRINTVAWLDAARVWLNSKQLLIESAFDYSKMSLEQEAVTYGNVKAKGVIFCEGMHAATNNPYFGYLPFSLTKGEVLIVKAPELALEVPINSSVFVLPLGDHLFKIGATYNWRSVDLEKSPEAKTELIQNAKRIIQVPFEVVEHKVGIRPTVRDRKPLLGTHPEYELLHIFNGMGSRGVLMVPWLAKRFLAHLKHEELLPKEANINRFEKLNC